MPLEVETASPWWGCLCACSSASKKPSKQEFFVPAGTDLGAKLLNSLTAMDACERPLFNKLLW
jgi:hypothetical protein